MEDREILMMLFQTHHSQLSQKRETIHGITRATVTALLAVTGWVLLAQDAPPSRVRVILSLVVGLVSVIACLVVYYNNRAYMVVARVVRDLNEALGLFEPGRFLKDRAVYPEQWRKFGAGGNLRAALHHWIAIAAIAALCVGAIALR